MTQVKEKADKIAGVPWKLNNAEKIYNENEIEKIS